MNALRISLLLLLTLALQLSLSLPVVQRGYSSEPEQRRRVARKVGTLNITESPERFMRNLYEELYAYDSEQAASEDLDKPTDVWCFPDRDIAKHSHRAKPFKSSRCTTHTQYVFQWSSVLDEIKEHQLNIKTSVLRAYVQMIDRHIDIDTIVDVNVTVFMVPHIDGYNASEWDEDMAIVAGQHVLTLAHDSDGWVELNVTAGIQEIWPTMDHYSELQVVLRAEVNCIGQKKVPFNFVNPAEIPLEQENRRERHMDIQPFLVVFGINQKIRAAATQPEDETATGEADNNTSNNTYGDFDDLLTYNTPLPPSKRSTEPTNDFCSISPYIINLHDLGLTNIIYPTVINISKCSGICNDRDTIINLGSNHAKIMTSIYNREVAQGEEVTATCPSCVPTAYEIVYFLMTSLDGTAIGIRPHDELVATECGCR